MTAAWFEAEVRSLGMPEGLDPATMTFGRQGQGSQAVLYVQYDWPEWSATLAVQVSELEKASEDFCKKLVRVRREAALLTRRKR